jgi:hypothetical protein
MGAAEAFFDGVAMASNAPEPWKPSSLGREEKRQKLAKKTSGFGKGNSMGNTVGEQRVRRSHHCWNKHHYLIK